MSEYSSCLLSLILSAITFAAVALDGALLTTYWAGSPTTGFTKDLTMVTIIAVASLAALVPPTVQLWQLNGRVQKKNQPPMELSRK